MSAHAPSVTDARSTDTRHTLMVGDPTNSEHPLPYCGNCGRAVKIANKNTMACPHWSCRTYWVYLGIIREQGDTTSKELRTRAYAALAAPTHRLARFVGFFEPMRHETDENRYVFTLPYNRTRFGQLNLRYLWYRFNHNPGVHS